MKQEKYLYRFYWNAGRMGSLQGLFVSTEVEIKDIIGRYANFGEVLGKHSEVYGYIEDGDVEKLDISSDAVVEVSKYLGDTWSGFNPVGYVYYNCEICEESGKMDDGFGGYRQEFEKELCDDCYMDCKSGGKDE